MSAHPDSHDDAQPSAADADALAVDFVRFAVDAGVLRFGEFTTKAGRLSPYFFNAGLFDDGARLGRLAEFYAARLIASGLGFDMLFGPAYKGITLAAAVAIELARRGRNVAFAYNRKEAKDHGEGGTLVGAALRGRVLILDDVISAGTSVRESVALIRAQGARAVRRRHRARSPGEGERWPCRCRPLGGAAGAGAVRHAGDRNRHAGRPAALPPAAGRSTTGRVSAGSFCLPGTLRRLRIVRIVIFFTTPAA